MKKSIDKKVYSLVETIIALIKAGQQLTKMNNPKTEKHLRFFHSYLQNKLMLRVIWLFKRQT